ncbi:hypothetical protein GCM10025768_16750 [Microbacterium pseudoresistens]
MVRIDGRRLRLTNLDKVVYPDTGTTKGEVIDYYVRIAPALLPVLAERPVTRKRWVEGVGSASHPGEAFFAKQLERGAPGWMPRMPIAHSSGAKEYPLVDEVAALVWLAQVAAIELHVPQWRFASDGAPAAPDRLVLDLDPGDGVDLAQCAEVARIARGILTAMGMDPVPVTSGSKGIHLYCALDGRHTSAQASSVAHELARVIEADHPDLVTSTMARAQRTGKVFLDWSQNNGAKTTVAPYSLRGRPQPWVAAPRTWAELDDPGLRQLAFDEVLPRVEAGIAPFSLDVSDETRGAVAPAPRPSRARERIRASAPADAPSPADEHAYSPMLAESGTAATARTRGGWAEIKWDGIRAIGTWRRDPETEGSFRLRARSGTDITLRYPELTADGAPRFTVSEAIVDGEIVAMDATGRPSFSLLQARMHLTRAREIEREVVRVPVRYHLFDLLRLDGHDLTGLPLRDRRELLERIAEGAVDAVVVPPRFDDVDAAIETTKRLGLEGIVAKNPDSPYRAGRRSPDWIKVKHTLMQEVVIVGLRPGKGDRAGTIGSLLLAVPDTEAPSGLRYVGRVGTGFGDRALRDLSALLEPLRIASPTVDGVPDADARDALWVRPEHVGEVEFAEWTPGRILRHARWRGRRPDKSPGEVTV